MGITDQTAGWAGGAAGITLGLGKGVRNSKRHSIPDPFFSIPLFPPTFVSTRKFSDSGRMDGVARL